MRFNSFIFLAFLPAVCIVLWLLPVRLRRWWLLAASYVFYGSWHWPYLALLFSVATLNHFGARWIIAGQSRARRGVWVLAANIVLLALFKYLDWLVGNANLIARLFGSGFELAIPHWVLPLGISFYMFEAISYTVDVIRKRERLHGFWDFQLFIAFFPKLIAGPILRAKEFLPQIERQSLRPTVSAVREGLWLLASGLFLKLVLANLLGPQVDEAFARSAGSVGAIDVWLMASHLGCKSTSIFPATRAWRSARRSCAGFNWSRISIIRIPPQRPSNSGIVGTCRFRDGFATIFFPLAGNRPTLGSMLRAALVAMTLCGLWHGAGWTFVLWGFYHGLLICGTHILKYEQEPTRTAQPAMPSPASRAWSLVTNPLATIVTFSLVSLGWILFRSGTIGQAVDLLSTALQPWKSHSRAFGGTFYAETAVLLALVWLAPVAARIWERLAADVKIPSGTSPDSVPAMAVATPVPVRFLIQQALLGAIEGVTVGLMLVLCLVFFYGQTQFIYFQF